MRENAAFAAEWTLAALIVQVAAAACIGMVGALAGAAIMSYIWMVRYLWRAKTLLKAQVEK